MKSGSVVQHWMTTPRDSPASIYGRLPSPAMHSRLRHATTTHRGYPRNGFFIFCFSSLSRRPYFINEMLVPRGLSVSVSSVISRILPGSRNGQSSVPLHTSIAEACYDVSARNGDLSRFIRTSRILIAWMFVYRDVQAHVYPCKRSFKCIHVITYL